MADRIRVTSLISVDSMNSNTTRAEPVRRFLASVVPARRTRWTIGDGWTIVRDAMDLVVFYGLRPCQCGYRTESQGRFSACSQGLSEFQNLTGKSQIRSRREASRTARRKAM